MTITRRKCNISGRCPATVNVNTDPVLAFGASEASNQTLPITTIFLKTTNGDEVLISVLVILRISQPYCATFYCPEIAISARHPFDMLFKQPKFDISLLIEADFYWSIVQEN